MILGLLLLRFGFVFGFNYCLGCWALCFGSLELAHDFDCFDSL